MPKELFSALFLLQIREKYIKLFGVYKGFVKNEPELLTVKFCNNIIKSVCKTRSILHFNVVFMQESIYIWAK